MFAWWPKKLSTEYILPLRALGKRKISLGTTRAIKGERNGRMVEVGYLGAAISFAGPLTLVEQGALKTIRQEVVLTLSHVLADGPKIFRMPVHLLEPLDNVAIPLAVKDFAPPFPAVIVERPNGEYHFVSYRDRTLMILTITEDGGSDFIGMLQPDRQIETYFDGKVFSHVNTEKGELVAPIDQGELAYHRFRATLNFLLLATMEGHLCQRKERRHCKRERAKCGHAEKVAEPIVYEVQNIKLFCAKTQRALEPVPEHQGGTKRPHLRRSHWRHVPCGEGRRGRKLVLIPWCFVNKDRLSEPDLADTSYTAQSGPCALEMATG